MCPPPPSWPTAGEPLRWALSGWRDRGHREGWAVRGAVGGGRDKAEEGRRDGPGVTGGGSRTTAPSPRAPAAPPAPGGADQRHAPLLPPPPPSAAGPGGGGGGRSMARRSSAIRILGGGGGVSHHAHCPPHSLLPLKGVGGSELAEVEVMPATVGAGGPHCDPVARAQVQSPARRPRGVEVGAGGGVVIAASARGWRGRMAHGLDLRNITLI